MHQRERSTVRRIPRPGVVVTHIERHALRRTAVEGEAVDLRAAAAVRGKHQRTAVRRPAGLGIDGRMLRQARQRAGAEVEQIDFRIAVT